MNSNRLNRWLTLGANLGVLIGIILLIVELDQNREMMRAQVRHDIASETIAEIRAIASDPILADIIVRKNNGEELSETEELQVRMHRYAAFRNWESINFQYRLGLFDEEENRGQINAWRSLINRPSYADYWCDYRQNSSAEFRAELESLMTDTKCR